MKWANPTRNDNVSSFLQKLNEEFHNLVNISDAGLGQMLLRLQDLKFSVAPKYQMYIDSVIYNIRRHIDYRAEFPKRHDSRRHELSDHAFVRVLEYIHGLDIDTLKDKALDDLRSSKKYVPVIKHKRVITIVPTYDEENGDENRNVTF